MHGYWAWDWADSFVRASGFENGSDTPVVNVSVDASTKPLYNYLPNGRVVLVNALCELDAPGEYYIDKRSSRLSFIPPSGTSPAPSDEITISTGNGSGCVLCLNRTSYLSFEDLEFGDARGSLIEADGVTTVHFRNLTLRNAGRHSIVLSNALNSSVRSSSLTGAGCTALNISGGDLRNLVQSGNVVEGNHISDFARISRTYNPGVSGHYGSNRRHVP